MPEGWERGRIYGISPPAGNKGRFLCPVPAIRSHPPEWLELKEIPLACGLTQPLRPSFEQSLPAGAMTSSQILGTPSLSKYQALPIGDSPLNLSDSLLRQQGSPQHHPKAYQAPIPLLGNSTHPQPTNLLFFRASESVDDSRNSHAVLNAQPHLQGISRDLSINKTKQKQINGLNSGALK